MTEPEKNKIQDEPGPQNEIPQNDSEKPSEPSKERTKRRMLQLRRPRPLRRSLPQEEQGAGQVRLQASQGRRKNAH